MEGVGRQCKFKVEIYICIEQGYLEGQVPLFATQERLDGFDEFFAFVQL